MRFYLFLCIGLFLSSACSSGGTVTDFDRAYEKRPFWAEKGETFFPCERAKDGSYARAESEDAPFFCATGAYGAPDVPNMREQLSLMTAEARAKEALNKGLVKIAPAVSGNPVLPTFTATYWERTVEKDGKTVFTAYAFAAVLKDVLKNAHSSSKDPL